MTSDDARRSIAARLAVAYALGGLVLGLAILAAIGALVMLELPGVWGGAIAAVLVAWRAGGARGGAFATTTRAAAFALGVRVALTSLLAGVLVGSLPALLAEIADHGPTDLGDDLFDFVVKPLVWVSIFGGLPAVLLGLAYGNHVRAALAEPDEHPQA